LKAELSFAYFCCCVYVLFPCHLSLLAVSEVRDGG
jgi:hypothetical protein